MSMRYFKKTPEMMEHIEYDVETPSGSTQVLIGVEKLIWSKRFTCMNDQDYTLSPEERLAALELARAERGKVKHSRTIKTLDGWLESDFGEFNEYFAVGDEVDEAVVDYFLDILPPRSFTGGYLQVGEPYSQEPDENGKLRATYTTFHRIGGVWHYIGECFAGGTESRVTPKTRLERAIENAREEIDDKRII